MMKVVAPETISENLKKASQIEVTPAGPKGIDKLKLATVRFLRKTAEGTAKAFNKPELGMPLVAGGIVASFAYWQSNFGGKVGFSKELLIGGVSAFALGAGVGGITADFSAQKLRNLEYKLVKKIQAERPSLLQRRQIKGAQYA